MNKINEHDKIETKLSKVISRLISLDETQISSPKELSLEEQKKVGYFARDFGMGHWDWPQGIGIFGLNILDKDYSEYIKSWAKKEIDKGLPLPNINTICPLMTLMEFPEYEDLSLNWVKKVLENFNRTKEGGLQHDTTGDTKDKLTINSNQLWVDTTFMTVLFLQKMGQKYQQQNWIDEANYQLLLHIKYLLNVKTKLFAHGWDFQVENNFGSIFWCRGNSWMTMAIPLFLENSKDTLPESLRKYLEGVFKNQVDKLVSLQDDKTGLWHTILDDESSYLETSGSSGILAGIALGISQNCLSGKKYHFVLEKGLQGLLQQIDDDGTVIGVSAGTAISNDSTDYKNIIVQPMAYGQALMIFALAKILEVKE